MRLGKVLNGIGNERGIALVTVLLVALVIATLAVAAAMLGGNATLVMKYRQRETLLQNVADAGIEEARGAVNGDKTIMPDTGFKALETNAVVYDATGKPIPNVTRSTYIGPTGITSGQYGVYASAVTVVKDAFGDQVVRRGEFFQESFAKYAYFTNVEGTIYFANGDQIYGPVHSNDVINIASSGATFFGPVTTAKTISGKPYGTFKQGYTERAAAIPFPTTADLGKLQTQAAAGNMVINGTTGGALGQATVRIEFVALDLDGDGKTTGDNEGFIRVGRGRRAGELRLHRVARLRAVRGFPQRRLQERALALPRDLGHERQLGEFPEQRVEAVLSGRGRFLVGQLPTDGRLWSVAQVARRGEQPRGVPAGRAVSVADQPGAEPELQGRHFRQRQRGAVRQGPRAGDRGGDRQHRDRRQSHLRDRSVARHVRGDPGTVRGRQRGDGRQHAQLAAAAAGAERPDREQQQLQDVQGDEGRVRARRGAGAQPVHGGELHLGTDERRGVPNEAGWPRVPLPDGRDHSTDPRRGGAHRRPRLHQAVLL